MIGIAALLLFLSLVLAGYALATRQREREETDQAIRKRLSDVTLLQEHRRPGSLLKDQRLSAIPALNRLLQRFSPVAAFMTMTQQAGMQNRVGEVLLYIPLLAMVGGLVGVAFVGSRTAALGLAALGGALPVLYVRRRRAKRMAMFSEQLSDALDLVRSALQAGHSLATALYVVADEFPDPVAEEFRTVAEEMRLGLSLREALTNLRMRVDDHNVPILVIGLLVAQEVGGNLAEVLDNMTYTIRERFKLLRDAEVMTSQGRFSGRILTALPFLVGLVMFFLNPVYFAPMIERETGWYMMGYALCSIVVGHIIIQRIVSIRV